MPTISPSLRTSINQNLNEIIELHEEILEELHRIVPPSDYHPAKCVRNSAPSVERETRSLTNVISDSSWMHKVSSMTAEAPLAAEVAKIFGQKV
jgi:hypothetical protein